MDFLPIFVNIKEQPCTVVGGGSVAARKVALLLKAEARVTVISPKLAHELAEMAEKGDITHLARKFEDTDVEPPVLIIASTDDETVNRRISELAKARGIPVNVVDNPDLCSFIMPSIVDRSPVQIAISTGGASPVLARMIRTKLEGCIPAAYGRLGALVTDFREKVKAKFSNVEQRRKFWEDILEGTVAERIFTGKEDEARSELEQAIEAG